MTSLLGTTAVANAMPTSAAHGWQTQPYAGLGWFLVSFELGPWEEYLIHELTPELDRLTTVDEPRVSWLEFDQHLLVPDFAQGMLADSKNSGSLRMSLRQSRSSLMMTDFGSGDGLPDGYRFRQSLIMPSVTHRMSDQSALTVSAILASQRFGASEMNFRESDDLIGMPSSILIDDPTRSEVVHGAGLRFALSGQLLDNVQLEAAFQSRIDMSEFATVRGVHGTHAELDIPSRLQLGLELNATERTRLRLGISQIFYSEIGAFPSRSLPARFNALLGDSGSPRFVWDDLMVYNLGWSWRNDDDLELFFDYRTRTQPTPTAPSLASALSPELARNSMLVGVSKGINQGRLHLNAAYAPPEYAFGGNVLGVVSDKLDQGLEVQAAWSMAF
ncbi:hypothetical protein IC757_05485 [Wenzhouxiangella sp. AB-CW3]|nr:hypothetical protein IC757_05485 [Wenzhouxiangella sp. AB-CW3]